MGGSEGGLILRVIHVTADGLEAAEKAVRRSVQDFDPKSESAVREIIADVRARGDAALLGLGRRFDCPTLESIEVSAKEWDDACVKVDAASRQAVESAANNITSFHKKQLRSSWKCTQDGATTGQLIRPLQRVGVYVPGGTAVYPSSVLMTALPANVAGVGEIIVCTPCGSAGRLHPLVLFAARTAGVSRVFKVGGAQAIAAMAYGTETIPAVDKVVGPGNVYVNIAKKLLWGVVDIDMVAGPSEVCVVADDSANPALVAADMLTQAEHDTECAAYLITPSEEMAMAVQTEISQQVFVLPRAAILEKALGDHGAIVVTETLDQAVDLANVCAPEHLALMVREPFEWVDKIRNAGAVLLGDYSPQTLGDYLAGPSHTLPTSGTARFSSPLNVDTFVKKTSLIHYTREALERAAPTLEHFAGVEGFEGHAEAVRKRL
jgi:histidinol dehydrogenase